MPKLKPLSVVYGEYGLNTGFRTRIELIKRILADTTGTSGDWLTFERQLACKIVQKENSNLLIRIPRTRSVSNLFKNFTSIKWGKLPEELGLSYNLVLAHSFNSVFIASALKKRFRAPLLLDIHGVWLEEVMSWSKSKSFLKVNLLKLIEEVMLSTADAVIFASNALKEVMFCRYPFLVEKPNAVIQCAVDSDIFKFRPEARYKLRNEWDWENCTVIVHSGIKAPWVDVPCIKHFAKICCEHFPEVRFLFLANDPFEWKKTIKGIGNETQIKIISVEHKDMPSYLSAADIGFIARTDSPINRVASPTKISEYLAIGLPILMTNGIGDYDNWIRQYPLGFCLPDLMSISLEQLRNIFSNLHQLNREQISRWARTKLSLDTTYNDFYRIYKHLAGKKI